MMRLHRYGMGGALALLVALAAATASAHCAVCVNVGNIPCPSAAPECFTDIVTATAQCEMLGCFGAATGVGQTCGEGAFAYCAVIDGVPVGQTPTATPTHTATATATETETATATSTASETATATATATATSTASATGTATATATATATGTPTASPVPQGGACADPSQCVTGHCADGVCCDTACDQPLEQCNLPGQVGTCANTAAAAPAASSTGLLLMLGVLVGAGFAAFRARRA
jgi:hypothetical protein